MVEFTCFVAVLGIAAIIIMCLRIMARLDSLEQKINALPQHSNIKKPDVVPTPDIVNRALKSNEISENESL